MFRNIFYNGLAIAVTTLTATIASVVLARALGPDLWGIYSQANWFISIAVAVFGGGLLYTAMRFLGTYSVSEDLTQRFQITAWLVIVQLLLIAPVCLMLLVFATEINQLLGWHLDPLLIQLSAIGVFAFSLFQLGTAMLRGLQEFRVLAILAILGACITLGTTLLVLQYPDISLLIGVTAFGQLLLIPAIAYGLRGHLQRTRSASVFDLPDAWRLMLRYSLLVYLTTLVDQIVWQRSEVFFLAQLSDPAESGYYALAYTVAGTAFAVITMAITGTLTPAFSSSTDVDGRPNAELASRYKQSFSLLSWITLPCAVGFAIVGPTVVTVLYGGNFRPVIPVLYILTISSVIGVYARPSASVLHAINRPAILLVGGLLVLPLNLILAWYWVPRQGAVGAAVANLAAQAIGAGIALVFAKRLADLSYDWVAIGKSLISAMVCGVVSWAVISHTPNPVVSVFIAVGAGATAYILSGMLLGDQTTKAIISALGSRLHNVRIRLARHIAGSEL